MVPGLGVAGIQVHEVGIVGIGVVAGEEARQQGRCPVELLHVEADGILILGFVIQRLDGHAQLLPQGALLPFRGFGDVEQGVQRGPVGEGDGTLGVELVPLEGQEMVQALGQELFHGVAAPQDDEAADPVPSARMLAVEGHHAGRFPLAAQNDGQSPRADVRPVGAIAVPRAHGEAGATVEDLGDIPHLPVPGRQPGLVEEVMAGGQLGPDTMDEPDWFPGAEIVGAQGLVEGRRVDGVDADRVDAGFGHLPDPPVVGGPVGKLAGVSAGEGRAEVHTLDVEGPPAAVAIGHFQMAVMGPGRDLRLGGQGDRSLGGFPGSDWAGGLPQGHGIHSRKTQEKNEAERHQGR